ncbi:MAG: polymer-forming cytoskeletal protein [Coriobacteriia bacterium]|nr:polymer-forming cytoskeletal protein [Coriobacteriia bacterium]
MTDPARADMKINGDGSLPSGKYGAVTINGAGTVNGDIDAITFKINGTGTSQGRVVAQSITVNGSGTFNGEVQAGEMTVNGDASVRDGAGIGRLVVKGNLSVGGGIAAHQIEIKGFLKTGGDCEAESVTGEGAFTITGLLNAGVIDLKVYGPCSAKEMGGERIVVRQPGSGFSSFTQIFTFWAEKRLTADTIEGDDVWLEITTAKTVRGRNITVGSNCVIDLVEYSGTYTPLANAQVKEVRQIAPEG